MVGLVSLALAARSAGAHQSLGAGNGNVPQGFNAKSSSWCTVRIVRGLPLRTQTHVHPKYQGLDDVEAVGGGSAHQVHGRLVKWLRCVTVWSGEGVVCDAVQQLQCQDPAHARVRAARWFQRRRIWANTKSKERTVGY